VEEGREGKAGRGKRDGMGGDLLLRPGERREEDRGGDGLKGRGELAHKPKNQTSPMVAVEICRRQRAPNLRIIIIRPHRTHSTDAAYFCIQNGVVCVYVAVSWSLS